MLDEIIDELLDVREEILEGWANGTFTTESSDGTAQLNAQWLGQIQMLDQVIDLISSKRGEFDET